jgi:hypothetical protein
MAGKEFIVQGAVCRCKYGSGPGKLKVIENNFFKINGSKLSATTMTLGNVFEAPGFGKCNANPLFPKPCMPTVTEWSGGFKGLRTSYGGNPLTDKSKGTCSQGCPGCIEFVQTGQIPVPGMRQVRRATAEHQGELDCAGSPLALMEHSVKATSTIEANRKKMAVIKVMGETEASARETIVYQVERYNVSSVSAAIRQSVKWKVVVDQQEISITQPCTDSLELFVQERWQGKKLEVSAYITDEQASVVTNVLSGDERIIVIGTQQHSESLVRNISPFHDVGPNSKFMFVHQALRKIRLNLDLKWTILLCEKGYTEGQLAKIKSTFEEIRSEVGEQVVAIYKTVSSPEEIIDYVNKGKDRKHDKVCRMLFYSHGVVGKITPWMHGLFEGDVFDKSVVRKISKEAFSGDADVYSFACRTGLGNPQIDKSVYINREKNTRYDLLLNQSLAQNIADASTAIVYAYLKRTYYGDTLFSSDELDFLDACDAVRNDEEQERPTIKYEHIIKQGPNDKEKSRYKRLNEIRRSDIMVDGGKFRKTGALHPVRAADTPEGLPDDMKMYRSIKK